jgi:NADPH2:quinone reductase
MRLVQVGEAAGGRLALAAESLRTSGVQICGAAKGLDGRAMRATYEQVVAWVLTGELAVRVERVPLAGIEQAWRRTDLRGRRLVVIP